MIPKRITPPPQPAVAVDAYQLVAAYRQARLSGDVADAAKILETLRHLAVRRPAQPDADGNVAVEDDGIEVPS